MRKANVYKIAFIHNEEKCFTHVMAIDIETALANVNGIKQEDIITSAELVIKDVFY